MFLQNIAISFLLIKFGIVLTITKFLQLSNYTKFKLCSKKLLVLLLIIFCFFIAQEQAQASATGWEYEYRFTEEAMAADYAQCSSIAAPLAGVIMTAAFGYITYFYVQPCMAQAAAAAVATGGIGASAIAACFSWYINPLAWATAGPLAALAGGLFLVGAYLLAYEITDHVRMDAYIVNTFDPECTWKDCYDPNYDHTINPEENPNFNLLGVGSFETNDRDFIRAYDCDVVTFDTAAELDTPYFVCVYEEGDELCSEIVFCSGIIQAYIRTVQPMLQLFGMSQDDLNAIANSLDFDRIPGRPQNAYIASGSAKRECGEDPWTDKDRDDANPYTVNGNRCECTCCDNSEEYEGCCGSDNQISSCVDKSDLICDTFNERYRYHCVPKVFPDEELPSPVALPSTISVYCDSNNEMGYLPFPFSGRIIRCLHKTLENIFYGYTDTVVYDSETNKPLKHPDTNEYIYRKNCSDGGEIPADGYCSSSFITQLLGYLKGFVTTVLTLHVALIGVKILIGGQFNKKELFTFVIQVGFIGYFALSDGWRDGYFPVLLSGGYEIAMEYFDAISDYEVTQEDVFPDDDGVGVLGGVIAGCVLEGLNTSDSEALLNELDGCDFFDGYQYSGAPYRPFEQYFSVWDSLDCRFANYVGFTKNGFYPALIAVAFAALFTSSTGIMFLIVAVVLFVSIFLIFFRALFIGVVSAVYIMILVFISPLTFLCLLFRQTNAIFAKWLQLLIAYSLQPMVLFAFLALIMAMLDIFFVEYMADVINLEVSTRTELGLSIAQISTKAVSFSYFVGGLLKFTFFVLIIQEIFNKLDELLKSLTGVSADGAMPDLYKHIKAAGKVAYAAGKNVAGNVGNKGYQGAKSTANSAVKYAKKRMGVSGEGGGKS